MEDSDDEDFVCGRVPSYTSLYSRLHGHIKTTTPVVFGQCLLQPQIAPMAFPYAYAAAQPGVPFYPPAATPYYPVQQPPMAYFTSVQQQQQAAAGRLFNSWPGVPDKKAKDSQQTQTLNRARERHDNDGDGDNNDDDSGSCSCSDAGCSSNGPDAEEGRRNDDSDAPLMTPAVRGHRSGVREVVIHPGGSGRVVVHVAGDSTTPQTPSSSSSSSSSSSPPSRDAASTSFVVSVRAMQRGTRAWSQMCRAGQLGGTESVDTTVTEGGVAVTGMYWLLVVLHKDAEGGGKESSSSSSSSSSPLHPVPTELPVRVLAYAALFARQLGAWPAKGDDARRPQSRGVTGLGIQHVEQAARDALPLPVPSLSAHTQTWLRSLAGRPRNRRVLDGMAAADWPYALYAARALSDRELFGRCLRTLLQRWHVDGQGRFCDGQGPVRLVLPEAMHEAVSRDLSSLRSARERSIESLVHGAVSAFF